MRPAVEQPPNGLLIGILAVTVLIAAFQVGYFLGRSKPARRPAPTVNVTASQYSDGNLGYMFHIKDPLPNKFWIKVFIDRFSGAVTWYHEGMVME